MNYINLDVVNLKNHSQINESWVQNVIAKNPHLLGLGELELIQRERRQPRAGRLDFLFKDINSNRIYEIELQLGKSDESHIIRTIEYWDLERKRYPQYDHVAVIIAEDITSRFLNVISLFNGNIPIIALQMSAIQINDQLGLHFIKVLDESLLKEIDEDIETVQETTDRSYWECRASKETVECASTIVKLIQKLDEGYNLKYNKAYIGLEKGGISNNFIFFKPTKKIINAMFKIPSDIEIEQKLDEEDLDYSYNSGNNSYTVKLAKEETHEHEEIISLLVKKAYDNFNQ